jgi:hypothetical protein
MPMRSVSGLAILAAVFAARAVAADPPTVCRLSLTGALPVVVSDRTGQRTIAQDLSLDVPLSTDSCDRVAWGYTPYVPGLEHLGAIESVSNAGERLEATVRLDVLSCKNSPVFVGGSLRIRIEAVVHGRQVEGTFAAEAETLTDPARLSALEDRFGYGEDADVEGGRRRSLMAAAQGVLAATATTGRVSGRLEDRPAAPPGFARPRGGEHPRLLFRRDGLERLRTAARTPEGARRIRQIEAMLDTPGAPALGGTHDVSVAAACHGFLHAITGDAGRARKARDLAMLALLTRYEPGASWRHGYTLTGVGLAYDLCYEGWSEADRSVVYHYIEEYARQFAQRHDQPDVLNTDDRFRFANPVDHFAYGDFVPGALDGRMGALLASLAILDDPPPRRTPPPMDAIPVLAPMTDYEPWFGVPVVPFASDAMPDTWLMNGPFPRGETDAIVREKLGGWQRLRPEPGQTLEVEGTALPWRLYHPGGHHTRWPQIDSRSFAACFALKGEGTGGASGVVAERLQRRAPDRPPEVNVLLYTVIENDLERYVQATPNWRSPSFGARMWINGRPVEDGDLFRLQRGRYAMVVELPVPAVPMVCSPKLREYNREIHSWAVSAVRSADVLTGSSVEANRVLANLHSLRRSVARYVETRMQGRGPSAGGNPLLILALLGHRQAMGFDFADARFEETFQWAIRHRGLPGYAAPDIALGLAYALMPESRRPFVLWCLQQRPFGAGGVLDAIVAFATMPAEAVGESPEGKLPRVHRFAADGSYVFNSGFGAADGFILTLMTGVGERASRYAAGGLALSGMGTTWLRSGMPAHAADREFTGLVPIELFPAGPPEIVHERTESDGSGVVTLFQDRYVKGRAQSWIDDDTKGLRRTVALSTNRVPSASTFRSVAVDYSGRCGAPLLVAVADRIRLARKREVVWRLAPGDVSLTGLVPGPRGPDKPGEYGYRLRGAADACLAVTHVAPEEVEFRLRNDVEAFERGVVDTCVYRRSNLEEQAARRSALAAKDAARVRETWRIGARDEVDEQGARPVNDMELADNLLSEISESDEGEPAPITFLVVATLQRGEPPAVETLARGDRPVARVGRRIVRFDGTNVVFGAAD